MNSLKFVKEKINWTISMIKQYEERLLKFKGNKENKERSVVYCFVNESLNNFKEELETLKQIEAELEAWELVKELLGLNVEIITSVDESNIKGYILVYKHKGSNIKMYKTIEQQEYETLKKALEIK